MSTKIMQMASSMTHSRSLNCLYPARLAPQPPDLIKWVRREGGFVHKSIKIQLSEEGNSGLGLFASDDIAKGSELISLPSHIPLRFEAGEGESPVLIDLARQIPEELWAMKLGLKLLQERAKLGSFWWPYISNLPETFSLPIFFSGEDVRNLQYAPLVYQVNKRCKFLHEFEKLAKNKLGSVDGEDHPFGGQNVDASSLGWAMSAVSSRAFRLYGGNRSDRTSANTPMLLPLIDMCNHSFTPNAEIVQETKGDMLVKVIAETQIKRDDPLELNYGCLNNDLFLLDYGFVVPSSPYDCVEFQYDMDLLQASATYSSTDNKCIQFSTAPWKEQLLYQLKLVGENADLKVRIGGSELVEGRFLAALRILLSHSKDEESAAELDLDTLKSIHSMSPIGSDEQAFRVLISLCVIALHGFPTKIMDDEVLLQGKLSPASQLAIRYRLQKKMVLVDAIRDFNRKLKQATTA